MVDDELKQLIEGMATEMRGRFETIDKRFDGVDQRFDRIDGRLDRVELKVDGLGVVTDSLQKKLEIVAESVLTLSEKLDREAAGIREEMHRGFEDTHAMIKFSHTELDRRVRALEES